MRLKAEIVTEMQFDDEAEILQDALHVHRLNWITGVVQHPQAAANMTAHGPISDEEAIIWGGGVYVEIGSESFLLKQAFLQSALTYMGRNHPDEVAALLKYGPNAREAVSMWLQYATCGEIIHDPYRGNI